MSRNYTPIHQLIKKRQQEKSPPNKEMMPGRDQAPIEYKVAEEHTITDAHVAQHIEVRPETVTIPQEVKQVGVQPIANPQFVNFKGIKLPLPEEKIPVGLTAPVDSSFKWLATLAVYVLQQSHSGIKKAHGKVAGLFKG